MFKILSDQEKRNGNNSERQDVEEGNMNELVNLCTYWENFYLHPVLEISASHMQNSAIHMWNSA